MIEYKSIQRTMQRKTIQSNALDVVLVGAVGLQGIAGVCEVLVGDEHGQGDAESEGCHDKQHL